MRKRWKGCMAGSGLKGTGHRLEEQMERDRWEFLGWLLRQEATRRSLGSGGGGLVNRSLGVTIRR
jgi:hypothetical protein